ncbi:hypothetical protein NC651_028004 [Populus alba x Populus x berolinensis]|nr:hypothetical protein NC651_028004 [Populus alba x Populus x berolinensis]
MEWRGGEGRLYNLLMHHIQWTSKWPPSMALCISRGMVPVPLTVFMTTEILMMRFVLYFNERCFLK